MKCQVATGESNKQCERNAVYQCSGVVSSVSGKSGRDGETIEFGVCGIHWKQISRSPFAIDVYTEDGVLTVLKAKRVTA